MPVGHLHGLGWSLSSFSDFYVIPAVKRMFAPVPKTGQTASYEAGDDGVHEKGVAWPSPRFTDNGNGTVTDRLTGLIWTKNANCDGVKIWDDAVSYCNGLADGTCGLSDASGAGDCRLANVRELQSLFHYGCYDPVLPNTAGTGKWSEGDPFTGVPLSWYYASTTNASSTSGAWSASLSTGYVYNSHKTNGYNFWYVRGGR